MKLKLVNIYKFHMWTLLRRPGIEPGTFALCRTTLPTWLSKPSEWVGFRPPSLHVKSCPGHRKHPEGTNLYAKTDHTMHLLVNSRYHVNCKAPHETAVISPLDTHLLVKHYFEVLDSEQKTKSRSSQNLIDCVSSQILPLPKISHNSCPRPSG